MPDTTPSTHFPLNEARALIHAALVRDTAEIDRITDELARQGVCRPRDDMSRMSEWHAANVRLNGGDVIRDVEVCYDELRVLNAVRATNRECTVQDLEVATGGEYSDARLYTLLAQLTRKGLVKRSEAAVSVGAETLRRVTFSCKAEDADPLSTTVGPVEIAISVGATDIGKQLAAHLRGIFAGVAQ